MLRRIVFLLLAVLLTAGLLTGCGANKDSEPETKKEAVALQTRLAVMQDGKWGYVDETGKFIIEPKFQCAQSFSNTGFAWVTLGGKVGCINQNGDFVVQPQYDGVITEMDHCDFVQIMRDGKVGIGSKNGVVVVEPKYTSIKKSMNEYGWIMVLSDDGTGGTYTGYLNSEGKEVIPPKYYTTSMCLQATEFVHMSTKLCENHENCIWFDANGNILGPVRGALGELASNGLAYAQDGEKYGYVDKKLNFIIAPQFENAGDFAENGLAPVKSNGKWGYIDAKGSFVIQPRFDEAKAFNEKGVASVCMGNKWGVINEKGEYVVEPWLDSIKIPGVIEVNKKYGFIDASGNILLQPQENKLQLDKKIDGVDIRRTRASDQIWIGSSDGNLNMTLQCEDIYVLAKDRIAILVEGKWGVVDFKGTYVLQPAYDDISCLAGDIFAVETNGKWGFVDSQGNYILHPRFDAVGKVNAQGYAPVKNGDLWGYVDSCGKVVIEPRFEDCI